MRCECTLDFAAHQLAHIAGDALSQRALKLLANDFGNLSQRVLSMIAKNCDGKVPAHGEFTDADKVLMDAAAALLDTLRQTYDAQAFNKALDQVWQIVGDANRYVDEMAPWGLKKTDPDRMATVLYVLADTIRVLGVLMQPVVPDSAAKMLDQLALAEEGVVRALDGNAPKKVIVVPGRIVNVVA